MSFGLNFYLGVFHKKLEERIREQELQLKLWEQQPHLTQGWLIFPGDSLKIFLEPKKENFKDSSDIIIPGVGRPHFVETDLASGLHKLVRETQESRKLKDIYSEFIYIANKGKLSAHDVRLKNSDSDVGIHLGNIDPETSKLIPVYYRRKQPWMDNKEPRMFNKYTFSFSLLHKKQTEERPIASKLQTSWIPMLGTMFGVGAALISDENEHLLRPIP